MSILKNLGDLHSGHQGALTSLKILRIDRHFLCIWFEWSHHLSTAIISDTKGSKISSRIPFDLLIVHVGHTSVPYRVHVQWFLFVYFHLHYSIFIEIFGNY